MTNDLVANVARETREISLLIAGPTTGSNLSSPATFDYDSVDYTDIFSLKEEHTVQENQLQEAQGRLSALESLDGEKGASDSVLLARAYVKFATRDGQGCLDTLGAIDFERHPTVTATDSTVSAPGSAMGSLGTASGFSALESAISRSGTMAGSFGVTELARRLEGEVGDGKVWAVVERLRSRCLQGIYSLHPGL